MKIGYLGIGSWGFCLASLLASKGYRVQCWTTKPDLAKQLEQTREHPLLPGHRSIGDMTFTTDLAEAIDGADIIIESVTSAGFRPVLEKVKALTTPECPLVITSKGIEQNSGLILSDVAIEIFGDAFRERVASLSGPSFAHDVIRDLPTSVVGAAYNRDVMLQVCDIFSTDTFRVYPNSDVRGVAFGGALKNVIAIACGISEGLALGYSCAAALMTRGLHEIRKLAVAEGCRAETLYGLSGMGDLCLTCNSFMSRNYRFGHLLAQGIAADEAREKIGMVVEGAYTCVSALQLSRQHGVNMPIAEGVKAIIDGKLKPDNAVQTLMERTIKEEHL
ncbi:MAG: NAD(P)-dependent glycerol-3-phosphate dehydrogenase [Chlamydiales bacterium]|nr:NAD(P)-dependent glycerol-3-phosphate dehydrogenase [Chlamydiia bacterium]MCP5508020.1 NAD(P)-dependent glycerol-3-phosphate dehydrogenase [Chlamydiales bacterium]